MTRKVTLDCQMEPDLLTFQRYHFQVSLIFLISAIISMTVFVNLLTEMLVGPFEVLPKTGR